MDVRDMIELIVVLVLVALIHMANRMRALTAPVGRAQQRVNPMTGLSFMVGGVMLAVAWEAGPAIHQIGAVLILTGLILAMMGR